MDVSQSCELTVITEAFITTTGEACTSTFTKERKETAIEGESLGAINTTLNQNTDIIP